VLRRIGTYVRRNHLALFALFFALGGASFAAGSKLLPPNSVGTRQVVNHSLLRRDFALGQIPRGSQGPRGPQGPPGVRGAQGVQGAQGVKGDPTYRRTILVSPVSDNESANGQVLRDALASITDAASNKPYLVKLEPGTYFMGGTGLQMKPYVDLEGSGVLQTLILATVVADTSGAVIGASRSQLRWLSVQNDLPPPTNALMGSIAIYAEGSQGSVSLDGVRAFAAGGTHAVGMLVDGAAPTIERSSLEAKSFVSAMFPEGLPSEGLRLSNTDGVPSLTVRVRDSEISADTYGIRALNALTVNIDGSRVSGTTQAVTVTGPAAAHIGASQVAGPVLTSDGGTLTCAQSYDGSYTDLGPACA